MFKLFLIEWNFMCLWNYGIPASFSLFFFYAKIWLAKIQTTFLCNTYQQVLLLNLKNIFIQALRSKLVLFMLSSLFEKFFTKKVIYNMHNRLFLRKLFYSQCGCYWLLGVLCVSVWRWEGLEWTGSTWGCGRRALGNCSASGAWECGL